MWVKYEVKAWNVIEEKEIVECGIAMGQNIGEIVKDIEEYYGAENVGALSYSYEEDYAETVIPYNRLS